MPIFEPVFSALNESGVRYVVVGGLAVRVASLDDLIAMKQAVGRRQDLMDVEALNALKRARDGSDG